MSTGSPANYKTAYGLYRATVRMLESPNTVNRAWWLHNAVWHAEHGMNDPVLVQQLRDLLEGCGPRTVDDLKPIL